MRLRRKVAIGTAATLAVLSLAIAALPFWMPTRWIRNRIERELSAALGVKVQIDRIDLFWTGARIEKLQIANPAAFDPRPLLVVESAEAATSLLPLLRGKVDGAAVIVRKPMLRVVRSATGEVNLQALGRRPANGAAPAGGRSAPVALPFGSARLELMNAGVEFTDQRTGLVAGIPAADAVLSLDASSRSARGTVTLRTPGAKQGKIEVRLSAVPFKGAGFALAEIPAEAVATFQDADLGAFVRSAPVEWIPETFPLNGEARIATPDLAQFTVKAELRAPSTRWRQAGREETADLPSLEIRADGGFRLDETSIRLGRFRTGLGGSSVEGSASLEGWDNPALRAVRADLTLLGNLRELRAIAGTFAPGTAAFLPAGAWTGNVTFASDSTAMRLETQGTISDFQAPLLALPPGTLTYTVKASGSPASERYALETLEARLGPFQVQGEGIVTGPFMPHPQSVDARVRIHADDLGAALQALPQAEPGAAPMKASGKLVMTAKAQGDADRIPLSVTASGERIQLEGGPLARPVRIRGLSLDQTAEWRPQAKAIENVKLRFLSDFLNIEMDGGSVKRFPEAPEYDLSATASGDLARLQEVGALFGAAAPEGVQASGTLSGILRLRGDPDALSAEARISAGQPALTTAKGDRIPLDPLALETRLVLKTKKKELDLAALTASASGLAVTEGTGRIGWGSPDRFSIREGKLVAAASDPRRAVAALQALKILPEGISVQGRFDLRADKIQGSLRKLTTDLSAHGKGVEVRAGVPAAPVTEESFELTAKGAWDGTARQLTLQPIELRSPSLSTAGTVAVAADPNGSRLEAAFPELKVDLAAAGAQGVVKAFGPPDLEVGGTVRGTDLMFSLSPSAIRTHGSLDLGGAALCVGTLMRKPAELPLRVAWEARGGSPAYTLDRLRVDLPAGVFALSGSTDMKEETFAIRLDRSSIDLAELARQVPALADLALKGKLALAADAKGNFAAPDVTASFKLEEVTAQPKGIDRLQFDGPLEFRMSPDGTDSLQSTGIAVQARDQAGTIQVSATDLVAGWRKARRPDGFSLEEFFRTARARLEAKLPAWTYEGNAIADARLVLTAENGIATIRDSGASLNGGPVTLSAQADFTSPKAPSSLSLTLAQTPVAIRNPKLLGWINPLLARAEGDTVSRFTVDLPLALEAKGVDVPALKASVRTPGISTLRLGRGRIENNGLLKALAEALRKPDLAGFEFESLEEDFEVKEEKIFLHATRFQGKDSAIDMKGWTGFDGRIEYRVFLRGRFAEGDSDTAKVVRAVNEAGGLQVTGTTAEPKIDLDFQKVLLELGRARLEDVIKKEGGKILEDLFKKGK